MTMVVYGTAEISRFLSEMKSSPEKLQFLAEKPDGSNYFIENTLLSDGYTYLPVIYKRGERFHKSNSPIQMHVSIANLDERDCIALTSLQEKQLQSLFPRASL